MKDYSTRFSARASLGAVGVQMRRMGLWKTIGKYVCIKQIRNSHRSIIEYLQLEDGTRVYLASSSYGATVYRVAPPHSYVEANDGKG